MSQEYRHPESGKLCTRQRFQQIQNVLNGRCAFHKNKPHVEGSRLCQECFVKAKAPTQRAPKSKWACVDWAKSNMAIAIEMGVTESAVFYQRRLNKNAGGQLTQRGKGIPRKIEITSLQEREAARAKFGAAVRSGSIKRKPCAVCDDPKSEGHHFDYRRPLEVIWLCKKHHGAVHSGAPQIVMQKETTHED